MQINPGFLITIMIMAGEPRIKNLWIMNSLTSALLMATIGGSNTGSVIRIQVGGGMVIGTTSICSLNKIACLRTIILISSFLRLI